MGVGGNRGGGVVHLGCGVVHLGGGNGGVAGAGDGDEGEGEDKLLSIDVIYNRRRIS